MLYFLNLRGFDPRRGVIAEPHNKYSFLLSETGVFEPDERNIQSLAGSLERSVDANGMFIISANPTF